MSESIYKTHVPASGNELFLKLKDGEKVRLRIVSDPAVSSYDGRKIRYNWVVINRENGKVHVYQAGPGIFKDIASLVDDWGDPREFDITIKRTGSGQTDTKYMVNPVPAKKTIEPSAEELAESEKVDLLEATKGKWLADYEEDGIMPDSINPDAATTTAPDGIEGESFDLSDVTPGL